LRGRGIGADQVVAIVATHLHLDHIGAFVDFPNAEVVAPATEFASGRTRGQLGGYVHLPGILRSGRARPILFERPGRHGFPGCFDLFGDGNVVLLDARGHTAGSAAVLLRDPESGRQTLMAGDAAYTGAEFRLARMSLLMSRVGFHRDWVRETWALLNEFERSHPSIPVVLSHDAEMYGGLCHDV